MDQFVIPTAASLESGYLSVAAGRDGDCLVLAEIESVFEEERDVREEAPHALCSGFLFEIKTFLADVGVEDVFEGLAFFGISEDFEAEVFADDFAGIGIEDVGAEAGGDFGDDLGVLEEIFDGGVRVEDDDVRDEFFKEADGGGFSGGDAAGESEG